MASKHLRLTLISTQSTVVVDKTGDVLFRDLFPEDADEWGERRCFVVWLNAFPGRSQVTLWRHEDNDRMPQVKKGHPAYAKVVRHNQDLPPPTELVVDNKNIQVCIEWV